MQQHASNSFVMNIILKEVKRATACKHIIGLTHTLDLLDAVKRSRYFYRPVGHVAYQIKGSKT